MMGEKLTDINEIAESIDTCITSCDEFSTNGRDYYNKNAESMDCQLITSINAYHYLTGKKIDTKSDEYKKLLKMCGCIAGACTSIKKSYDYLGFEIDKEFAVHNLMFNLERDCYVALTIWHRNYGFHSVAIVDYLKEAGVVKVKNFGSVTHNGDWMFLADLKLYANANPLNHREKLRNIACRTFKLKEI